MTVEDALPWLREHRDELLESIRQGKYKPQPVRRKEIPKPDGGVRRLGIPTVVDRVIQQAIAQQGLLECSRESGAATLNNKRTTRTGGILQHPCTVRVVAHMRLNRRVRNRTHGGVRGRGYSAPPTRS